VGHGAPTVSGAGAPSALASALGYRKFAPGHPPRVLLMEADYHVVGALRSAARELGWELRGLPTATTGRGEGDFLRELLTALVDFRPDFLLSVNHLGFDEQGVLAELLERFEIPLASWFVDHPLPILFGAEANARSNCQLFCFERTALPWLAAIGFEDPLHLPTGARLGAESAARSTRRFDAPLALVASSWWHKARVEPAPAVRREAQWWLATHPMDRAFAADGLAQALARRGAQGRLAPLGVQVALAETSMNTRADFVRALAPCVPTVYGDEHWRRLVPEVHLEASVDPEYELPALFAADAVHLNVTAEQMPTAVNQRVWDVPAMGGFLLTDERDDLLERFEDGRDVATFGDLDEALEKARRYLAHPEERRRIAARARQKVEAEHRTLHRLREMEAVLRARFS